jgi:hypothetical protein
LGEWSSLYSCPDPEYRFRTDFWYSVSSGEFPIFLISAVQCVDGFKWSQIKFLLRMEVDTLSSASRPEKCRSFDQHHELTL